MTFTWFQCLDRANCGDVFWAHVDGPRAAATCPYCGEQVEAIG